MNKPSIGQDHKAGAIAAFLVLLIGAIVVTPVCGLLFQCHCDWPWSRFYFDCNYFHTEVSYKCPWCYSDLAGFGSIGSAFILATLASVFLRPRARPTKSDSVMIGAMFGLSVFILTLAISGALSAYVQHYPFGVGGLFIN